MTSVDKVGHERYSSTIDLNEEKDRAQNPRKAATKAKEAHNNLEMMKRRLMVLQGQEEYNRYRTLDQEKRINRHSEIHEKIVKEKQKFRKSLEKVNDKTWVKQKCEQIREQLKHKLKQAKKNLIEEKTDRTHHIHEESIEHDHKIKDEIVKSIEENKSKKLSIQNQEEYTRQSVSRHVNDKIRRIKLNRSVDSGALAKKASQGEDQLSRLVEYEQKLIQKNSQSLQASQMMKRKFNDLFATSATSSTTKNNSLLPDIRAKTNNTNNSKHTNNSQTPMI